MEIRKGYLDGTDFSVLNYCIVPIRHIRRKMGSIAAGKRR